MCSNGLVKNILLDHLRSVEKRDEPAPQQWVNHLHTANTEIGEASWYLRARGLPHTASPPPPAVAGGAAQGRPPQSTSHHRDGLCRWTRASCPVGRSLPRGRAGERAGPCGPTPAPRLRFSSVPTVLQAEVRGVRLGVLPLVGGDLRNKVRTFLHLLHHSSGRSSRCMP